jgi:hypothetical protein
MSGGNIVPPSYRFDSIAPEACRDREGCSNETMRTEVAVHRQVLDLSIRSEAVRSQKMCRGKSRTDPPAGQRLRCLRVHPNGRCSYLAPVVGERHFRPPHHKGGVEVPGHAPGHRGRDADAHDVGRQGVVHRRVGGPDERGVRRGAGRDAGRVGDEGCTRRPPGGEDRGERVGAVEVYESGDIPDLLGGAEETERPDRGIVRQGLITR